MYSIGIGIGIGIGIDVISSPVFVLVIVIACHVPLLVLKYNKPISFLYFSLSLYKYTTLQKKNFP